MVRAIHDRRLLLFCAVQPRAVHRHLHPPLHALTQQPLHTVAGGVLQIERVPTADGKTGEVGSRGRNPRQRGVGRLVLVGVHAEAVREPSDLQLSLPQRRDVEGDLEEEEEEGEE